jgi:hypothetical protein
MKKVLLLMGAVLCIASVSMADHIGVYSDASGASCALGAPGFLQPHVIHKMSAGTTGSRFKVVLPPGTTFFGFNTPYTPVGAIQSDISLGYGVCLMGSNSIGTIAANWAPGVVSVMAADLQPTILYTDCDAAEKVATGGLAYVGTTGDCLEPSATEKSTWGQVKALYR